MEEPEHDDRFFSGFKTYVRYFNGNLFKDARAFPLERQDIGELLAAAKAQWKEVDPAIFGTLLEQALDPAERRRLGAHYTPRAYVQRLVDVTVMEPLRVDWQAALTQAEDAKQRGEGAVAVRIVRGFLHTLCTTRVLDPACGTGNFLYVSLELMKKLEGEVLETLAKLGESETLGLERETVDPHQLLGLELNPRAAAIAELVVWIGYLQQHYRTRTGHPAEPILRAFNNINFGRHEGYDAVLTWDGYPLTKVEVKNGQSVETYPGAHPPEWPETEFIVGNPPFIGNKRMREALGPGYVDTLRAAYPRVSDSVDFVMYWWERSAKILESGTLRRFGLVTTNSLTQNFNRRVLNEHVGGQRSVSLVMAIPNHPWTKTDGSAAQVRIAMTVAARDGVLGRLLTTKSEANLDSDDPRIDFEERLGVIATDLSVGPAVNSCPQLLSNVDLAHQGVTPLGEGFRISEQELEVLGLNKESLPPVVRPYLIGRDLVQRYHERFIIDFFGLSEREAREGYPALFQIVLDKVKPERQLKNRDSYRRLYWIYAEPRSRMREALRGLSRYIVTCRTAKHRIFSFIDERFVPDAKVIAIALSNAEDIAILSSRYHLVWADRTGAWLGVGDDSNYNHSECFAKFPFPAPPEDLRGRLRALGEELDATRKRVQADNPDLTLTGLYNVMAKLKTAEALTPTEEDAKDRGFVLILKDLHENIDLLTAEAYGWPADLSDEEVLERLVTLSAERAKEEAAGRVRWLRPVYQIPRFAEIAPTKSGELELGEMVVAIDKGLPIFPTDAGAQILAVQAALERADGATDVAVLARGFKRGGKRVEHRVAQALDTLALYGRANRLPDGRFVALRAAA